MVTVKFMKLKFLKKNKRNSYMVSEVYIDLYIYN